MPALANIQHTGFDLASKAPQFEIDLGTNTFFRIDGTTNLLLFATNQVPNRNSSNFFSSGWISSPAGGLAQFIIPQSDWDGIQKTTGIFVFRVTTRDNNYANFVRSLPPGQTTGAPELSTDEPTVSAISPQAGSLAGGETVNISGSGFEYASAVKFGTLAATSFQIVSESIITAVSPQNSAQGSVTVVVESPLGVSAANSQSNWDYLASSNPDFIMPIPGSTFTSDNVTFRWQSNGAVVEEWWLEVVSNENSQQFSSFVSPSSLTNNSGEVGNIPMDGRAAIARLWYKISGIWSYIEASYTTKTDASFQQDRQTAETLFLNEIIPIDDNQVTYPGEDDLLLIISNGRAALLPASWNMVQLPFTPGAQPAQQPVPVISVPTVGKEGIYLLAVGGRLVYEAGGARLVYAMGGGGARNIVFPHALGTAQRALGTNTIDSMIVKHIDQDHIRQFRRLKDAYGIPANRIYFSDAFVVGPTGTPGSGLQRMVQQIRQDHPNEQFNTIPTPTAGSSAVFRHRLHRGEVTIDLVGDTRVFNMLKALRRRGVTQSVREIRNLRDAAIPMFRLTHQASGLRILDITDLRLQDVQRYHDRMGADNFRRWVEGVKIIKGFQHHMGALEPATHAAGQADRVGMMTLLRETFLRNGQLDIIVQSRSLAPGSATTFRLNKSLVRVLADMGINVHLALQGQSGASGSAGAYNVMSTGEIRLTRGGTMESHFGDPRMQQSARALAELYQLSRLHQVFGSQIPSDLRNKLSSMSQAFQRLSATWDSLFRVGLSNVYTNAAQRGNFRVINVAEFRIALDAAAQIPIEYARLSSADRIEALESFRVLETRARFNQEVRRTRSTGRVSSMALRGMVRILINLKPTEVTQLISNSSLRMNERARLLRLTATPRTTVRVRVGSALLLSLMVAAEVTRWMPLLQARWYEQDVKPFLKAILWWQAMRIRPSMKGLDDNIWPASDEMTTDPIRIRALLTADDVNALALTGLPQASSSSPDEIDVWDILALTCNIEINHYLDWCHFVREGEAIKRTSNGWSYRVGDVIPTSLDYDVTEQWVHNDRLTDIINELYKRVQRNTSEGIAALRFGNAHPVGPTFRPIGYTRHEVYEGFPLPTFIARFKDSLSTNERSLWTPDFEQHLYMGFPADSVFYVFPDSASDEPVPQGKVAVGGANFATYESLAIQQLSYPRYVMDPQGNRQIVGFEDRYNRNEIMWADPNILSYMPIQ